MKVKTTAEAWKKANELFPTDYMKDDVLSKRAGYPQYYSTSPEHSGDHINDLNVRLEVVVGGKCTNIWIEEMQMPAQEKVHVSQNLYRDIWMLIGSQEDKAKVDMEAELSLLDEIDHLDPANGMLIKKTVDKIKDCRTRMHHFQAMMEQFEKGGRGIMAGYKETAKEMGSTEVFSVLHLMAEQSNLFRWEPLKWGFEYTYCQERLYLIRDIESRAMYLEYGDNPMDALEKVSDMLENLGGGRE